MTIRERFVTWGLPLAFALSVANVACSRNNADSSANLPTSRSGQGLITPARDAEQVFAFDGAAVSRFVLDPHQSTFAPHHRILRTLFDSLAVLLPQQQFAQGLARSWSVSSDGLSTRSALYARAQRMSLERTYAIPTYVLLYTVAASNKVLDLTVDQHGFLTFYDAWIRHES